MSTEMKTLTLEDFRQLARAYQKEHKCRWSEACRQVKKQHPESMAAFGGPRLDATRTPTA